jgi:hypothetical protein
MHICDLCNYTTTIKCNIDKHYQTKKHIENALLAEHPVPTNYKDFNDNSNSSVDSMSITCNICYKEYKHHSSYSRHKNRCIIQHQQSNNNIQILQKEIETLKNNYNHLVEMGKLKDEIRHLQINNTTNNNTTNTTNTNNTNNTNNTTNITNNNNIKISKIQFLNLNFGNVIDMQTFTENYKNKFGLTNQQARTLLENYQNDGVTGCVSALVYYLKKSAIQQYREIIGKDIAIEDIILPFLLSDKSLRDHFEKSNNGKWDKTTIIDNIKRLVTITNDQVYNHHKQYMNISGIQRKRIINGVLKASCYSLLSSVSTPDLYKSDNIIDSDDDDEDDDDTIMLN